MPDDNDALKIAVQAQTDIKQHMITCNHHNARIEKKFDQVFGKLDSVRGTIGEMAKTQSKRWWMIIVAVVAASAGSEEALAVIKRIIVGF